MSSSEIYLWLGNQKFVFNKFFKKESTSFLFLYALGIHFRAPIHADL